MLTNSVKSDERLNYNIVLLLVGAVFGLPVLYVS